VNTSCPNCGGTFSPEEFNLPSCKYCGKVLPNYAAAAQKVAVVQALMHDSTGSGIPDGMKGMVGPYAPFLPGTPYAGPPVAGIPPQAGGPVAAYGAAVPAIIEQTQRRIRSVVLWVVFLPIIMMLLVGAIIAFAVRSAVTIPAPTPSKGHHSMLATPARGAVAT
jgi:hypothetical protein